uniref:Uncharacterized protein n=1 Tax=Arundo donax TaxID=35708 RepID=A0A0A8ZJB6_ARUDO
MGGDIVSARCRSGKRINRSNQLQYSSPCWQVFFSFFDRLD